MLQRPQEHIWFFATAARPDSNMSKLQLLPETTAAYHDQKSGKAVTGLESGGGIAPWPPVMERVVAIAALMRRSSGDKTRLELLWLPRNMAEVNEEYEGGILNTFARA